MPVVMLCFSCGACVASRWATYEFLDSRLACPHGSQTQSPARHRPMCGCLICAGTLAGSFEKLSESRAHFSARRVFSCTCRRKGVGTVLRQSCRLSFRGSGPTLMMRERKW